MASHKQSMAIRYSLILTAPSCLSIQPFFGHLSHLLKDSAVILITPNEDFGDGPECFDQSAAVPLRHRRVAWKDRVQVPAKEKGNGFRKLEWKVAACQPASYLFTFDRQIDEIESWKKRSAVHETDGHLNDKSRVVHSEKESSHTTTNDVGRDEQKSQRVLCRHAILLEEDVCTKTLECWEMAKPGSLGNKTLPIALDKQLQSNFVAFIHSHAMGLLEKLVQSSWTDITLLAYLHS